MSSIMDVEIDKVFLKEKSEPVLKDISFKIEKGEFVAILGESGSGKSVLLNCLAGVIPLFKECQFEGNVKFKRESLLKLKLPEIAGKIGFIFDNPHNQLFCTTLEEDLAFGPCNMLLKPTEVKKRIEKALTFTGLLGYEKRNSDSLSGGETQRAVLASILTMDPEILVLDRPADQLDPEGRKDIYKKLKNLCTTEGKTLVVVEENFEDILPYADKFIFLKNGSLEKIITNPKEMNLKEYFKDNLVNLSNEKLIPVPNSCLPIIRIRNLNFKYDNEKNALKDITLDIYPGEFVSLVGKNGAGKTTLAKHLNGLLKPNSGDVIIDSLNTKKYKTAKLSKVIAYLFQNPQMQICCNTVEEEVGFALKIRKTPQNIIEEKVKNLLQELKLTDVAHLHPYKLQRGKLQRVALASCLINEPKILVVDEPTSTMSHKEALETMELINNFNQKGNTVIMITHNPRFALQFSSRIILLDDGEIRLDIKDFNNCDKELLKYGWDIKDIIKPGVEEIEATVGL